MKLNAAMNETSRLPHTSNIESKNYIVGREFGKAAD